MRGKIFCFSVSPERRLIVFKSLTKHKFINLIYCLTFPFVCFSACEQVVYCIFSPFSGLIGLTAEEVQLYETAKNPPSELLREWSMTGRGTVQELIKLLSELEREDIVSEINAALSSVPSINVTPPMKVENLPPNIL